MHLTRGCLQEAPRKAGMSEIILNPSESSDNKCLSGEGQMVGGVGGCARTARHVFAGALLSSAVAESAGNLEYLVNNFTDHQVYVREWEVAPQEEHTKKGGSAWSIAQGPEKNRCQSDVAESLPEDQKPECHPFWTDDDECNMPLPYDLEEADVTLKFQPRGDGNMNNIGQDGMESPSKKVDRALLTHTPAQSQQGIQEHNRSRQDFQFSPTLYLGEAESKLMTELIRLFLSVGVKGIFKNPVKKITREQELAASPNKEGSESKGIPGSAASPVQGALFRCDVCVPYGRKKDLQAAKGRCNSKAWDLEPWQTGLLCSSPAAALSEQVAELSLLDRLLCVLSELLLPSGSLKEYASDDRVQGILTRHAGEQPGKEVDQDTTGHFLDLPCKFKLTFTGDDFNERMAEETQVHCYDLFYSFLSIYEELTDHVLQEVRDGQTLQKCHGGISELKDLTTELTPSLGQGQSEPRCRVQQGPASSTVSWEAEVLVPEVRDWTGSGAQGSVLCGLEPVQSSAPKERDFTVLPRQMKASCFAFALICQSSQDTKTLVLKKACGTAGGDRSDSEDVANWPPIYRLYTNVFQHLRGTGPVPALEAEAKPWRCEKFPEASFEIRASTCQTKRHFPQPGAMSQELILVFGQEILHPSLKTPFQETQSSSMPNSKDMFHPPSSTGACWVWEKEPNDHATAGVNSSIKIPNSDDK
ncbi:hypothetical protein Nmel_012304 [Mimus melanotis]